MKSSPLRYALAWCVRNSDDRPSHQALKLKRWSLAKQPRFGKFDGYLSPSQNLILGLDKFEDFPPWKLVNKTAHLKCSFDRIDLWSYWTLFGHRSYFDTFWSVGEIANEIPNRCQIASHAVCRKGSSQMCHLESQQLARRGWSFRCTVRRPYLWDLTFLRYTSWPTRCNRRCIAGAFGGLVAGALGRWSHWDPTFQGAGPASSCSFSEQRNRI